MSSLRSHPVAHVGHGDNTHAGAHHTRGRNLEYPERAYDRVGRLAGRILLRHADGANNAEYEQGRLGFTCGIILWLGIVFKKLSHFLSHVCGWEL